jgi:hypothetical protein
MTDVLYTRFNSSQSSPSWDLRVISMTAVHHESSNELWVPYIVSTPILHFCGDHLKWHEIRESVKSEKYCSYEQWPGLYQEVRNCVKQNAGA